MTGEPAMLAAILLCWGLIRTVCVLIARRVGSATRSGQIVLDLFLVLVIFVPASLTLRSIGMLAAGVVVFLAVALRGTRTAV